MKNILFFIICVISVVITCYMVYRSWVLFNDSGFSLDNLCSALGAFGWLLITYKIVMKSYDWTKKLSK